MPNLLTTTLFILLIQVTLSTPHSPSNIAIPLTFHQNVSHTSHNIQIDINQHSYSVSVTPESHMNYIIPIE